MCLPNWSWLLNALNRWHRRSSRICHCKNFKYENQYTTLSFTVTNKIDAEIHYVEFLRKYSELRLTHTKRKHLFLNYRRGRCSTQVVGRRTIGSWPSKIVKYLKLKHPENYSGHSIEGPRQHCWPIAESYVEGFLQNKIEFTEKILHDGASFSSTAAIAVRNLLVSNFCWPILERSLKGQSSIGTLHFMKISWIFIA